MNSLFPRTISIRRPNNNVSPVAGATGYGGAEPVQEKVIFASLCAAIVYDRAGRADPANLPTDSKLEFYTVSLQYDPAIVAGTIKQNDVIVDDTGQRYQVVAVDWQLLGTTLYAQILLD